MSVIFGPIISRRFGVSLGVDLSPNKKQCNFDCVYCELSPSKTTNIYTDVIPIDKLLQDTKAALIENKDIDVLTITANGEPTLYPYLKDFIKEIKPYIPQKVKSLILSNGSLFGEDRVIEALKYFDIVKFSLDSGNNNTFKKVDRINNTLNLDSIMSGIRKYSSIRKNVLICEILIVDGINDNEFSMKPLAKFLREIKVDRVDLSTIDRPPAYNINAVSQEKLYYIGQFFNGLFISFPKRKQTILKNPLNINKKDIIDLLKKRPISIDEAIYIFSENTIELLKLMIIDKIIRIKSVGTIDFYTV